ncbi:MAG: hypothetical protein K2Q23_14465 [Bryobacteraceae bacterium]|nr:hypothetical protein [Bryobacteraceae bacterium]
MPLVPVVEPAGNDKYPQAKSVDSAKQSDTMLLPHVDSCFGVVFVLEGDELVGGHASMVSTSNDFQPAANGKAIVEQMKSLKGGKKVLGVFAWGDEDLFPRSEILGEFSALCLSVGPYESGGGVDITVDPATRKIHVKECTGVKSKTWSFSDLKKKSEQF